MTESDIFKLRFPIGEYSNPEVISQDQINDWIKSIETFPVSIFQLCSKLSTNEKNWIYRPGGWSVKQVVHHCADSHMNALIRTKLAITEDNPTVKPYSENLWAELIDAQDDNIRDSINILSGVHNKWVRILKDLRPEDMDRKYIHPEHGTKFSIKEVIGTYAWHCNHHLAHIKQALNSKGSFNASNN